MCGYVCLCACARMIVVYIRTWVCVCVSPILLLLFCDKTTMHIKYLTPTTYRVYYLILIKKKRRLQNLSKLFHYSKSKKSRTMLVFIFGLKILRLPCCSVTNICCRRNEFLFCPLDVKFFKHDGVCGMTSPNPLPWCQSSLLLCTSFLQSPVSDPKSYLITVDVKPDSDNTGVVESLRPTIRSDATTKKSVEVTKFVCVCVYVCSPWKCSPIHMQVDITNALDCAPVGLCISDLQLASINVTYS